MKEQDIRPDHLVQRYFDLSARDAEACFGDIARIAIPCVGCGGEEAHHEFDKNNFPYSRCGGCGTLFQCPRPPIGAFERFYRNSESSRYWADVFFPAVAEVRRGNIFRPRVDRLAGICNGKGIAVERLIEVGAGYGIFLDEWRRRFPGVQALAIEPSESLARECRAKGFDVVEDIVENVVGYDDHADLVACFEVLEHVYDPLAFVRVLARLVRPGGYIFVSALGVDGFDIQVLWEKSNSIFPPHHINFLSVAGFKRLFTRAGLVDVEVTTPGQLDVDIVRNAIRREPHLLDGHRFLRHLLADEGRAAAFQRFLADNRLSSHTWVIGRKPNVVESKHD
jgi:SAM-dependent methyltransferase